MSRAIYRRKFVGACSAVVGLVSGFPRRAFAAQRLENEPGYVVGEPTAEVVGKQVLADGGNAVDAIVAAALTAADGMERLSRSFSAAYRRRNDRNSSPRVPEGAAMEQT